MKNYILTLLLACILYNGYAQKTASVAITLENTNRINVERNNFFEQPHNYSLNRLPDDELRMQFNRGYELPRSPVLSVSKIDDHHYLLKYRSDKPGMVYFNYKPIYIIPGDSMQLTYKMTGLEMNTVKDSMIAHGQHSANYTFSNYIFNRELLKYRPDIKGAKYKKDSQLYYNDLARFYQINDTYFDELFNKKGCAAALVDYLKRKRKVDQFFDLFYYEQQLQNSSDPQLSKLSRLIDTAFEKNKFNPADTSFSFVMENLFKGYFKRLVTVKYNQLKTGNDYDHLYNYVKNYPDPFLREYFFYFLAMNYYKDPKNLNSTDIDALVEQSSDANIRSAFKTRI